MKKRDYFGTQQVFYMQDKTKVSEDLKSLVIKNGFKEFSKEGIISFLSFRYPILSYTMFEGYKSLDTGEFLDDCGKVHNYWKPKFNRREISLEDAIDGVEKLLIEAISKLVKDKVRIGITLSGGLDSSLITAIVKKHFPNKEVFTYSCGFCGEDEFEYSRIVANLFSDKHTELVLTKDDFIGENSILRALIKQKAAPLHPNELGLAAAEYKARLDLCDIVLCGEGADDIFGGYGKNLRMYLAYKDTGVPFYQFFMDNYRYFNKKEVKKLIKPKYLVDDLDLVRPVFEEDECPKDIKNQVFYFIQRIHTRGLIERGNNALKFNGFEPGFPFTYPDLVDYANSLDFEYKVHWKEGMDETKVKHLKYENVSEKYDTPKYILKKVAEKYLPYNIIYRAKHSFPVPFEQWFEQTKEYNLDLEIFNSKNISYLNGWKKFMVINLSNFIDIFKPYKK